MPLPASCSGRKAYPSTGYLLAQTLRAGQLVHAAVGARRVDVVLEVDRAPLLGPDERERMVGVGKGLGAHLLARELQPIDRLRVHRHQVGHPVAAVDVQQLARGAESVRGVDVAAVLLVEVQPPVALVVVPELLQVVDIGALDVENLPEEPQLGHVERRQLKEVVDAVFEHHAVALRPFGRVDQLPALLERHRRGDLEGHVPALLHGVDRHRGVQLPRRGDVDQVDVVAAAELLPPLLAAVGGRFGQTAPHENLLRGGYPLGV